MKKVLIDFEKSKDPFSGLGQFCLFLKDNFQKLNKNLNLEYFIPENKLPRYFNFLIPKSDVFHAIHQDCPYVPANKNTKYILTIHDLNALSENQSEVKKQKFITKLQKKIDRADLITFISEYTKSDVEKYFNLKNKRTDIIYNGISLPKTEKKPNYIPQKNFLFVIGTVVPKKNFHVLIPMMEYLPDLELVIAGTTFHQYAKDIQQEIERLKLNNRVHLIGTISNEEKLFYYNHASGFLFPSLLEGFGLPVAEAQSLGLPLFLSKFTSLPEVGGDYAYYFNNFEPKEMAALVREKLENPKVGQKENLILDSKRFSWEKAAAKYLEHYNNL